MCFLPAIFSGSHVFELVVGENMSYQSHINSSSQFQAFSKRYINDSNRLVPKCHYYGEKPSRNFLNHCSRFMRKQ